MNDYDCDATPASDDILGLYMRAGSEEFLEVISISSNDNRTLHARELASMVCKWKTVLRYLPSRTRNCHGHNDYVTLKWTCGTQTIKLELEN